MLITSVIDTPQIPLSYTPTRSAFTKEERYEQTKKSIQSIRTYLPNSKILLIECSNLTEEYQNYITSHVDYFLNIYNEEEKRKHVYSIYKAEGESQLMIDGLKFIFDNNLQLIEMIFVNFQNRYNSQF